MADIKNLLSQMVEDEEKLYLLKNRDLITEDSFTVLQNDNGSTVLRIYMPRKIGRDTIGTNFNFYIDYIDGAGKPGVVKNETVVKNLYKQDLEEENKLKLLIPNTDYVVDGGIIEIDPDTIYLEDIENNTFTLNNEIYYVESNVKYSYDGKTYDSFVKNLNYEDSVDVSVDYPSGYSNTLYFIKESPNLRIESGNVGTYPENPEDPSTAIQYIYFEWELDKQVTNSVGTVTFSIRIESSGNAGNEHKDFIYQSNPTTFKVVPNLKETYYLKKEIEENFVVQNRTIKPVGNFNNVLVKGDTNSNKIFYKMNRYFQGQDMLAKREYSYSGEDFPVYKNQNNVFACQLDDEGTITYNLLQVLYSISNIQVRDQTETGTYNQVDNSFTIGEVTYHITKLLKEPTNPSTGLCKYQYKLYYKINDGNTEHSTESFEKLNGIITLFKNDGETETQAINYNISAIGQEFESVIYSDGSGSEWWAVVSTDNKWDPMFNRLIRFNFLSPNKDYGDSNNGEIEYIDPNEDYFIFSWTPDARVTRMAGDVSYYIEFYINGNFEEVLESGETTVVRSKSYSWSTLPSTIRVESNEAATASSDYIPHWVSYVENNLQDDMDAFLHSDLQSQYNGLEDYLLYTFLGDYYDQVETSKNEGSRCFIDVDNIEYTINKQPNEDNYDINLSNSVYNLSYTCTALKLEDSIYGAALQIREEPIIEVIELINDGTSVDFTTDPVGTENRKIYITISNTQYNANYPTSFVDTLTFTHNSTEIVCDVVYNNLVNNYYLIYNSTLDNYKLYRLTNESGNPVPLLAAAEENVKNWLQASNNQMTDQENRYLALVDQINTAFGADYTTTDSLYTKIWNLFNNIAATLHYYYDGNQLTSINIGIKDSTISTQIDPITMGIDDEGFLYFNYGDDPIISYYGTVINTIENKQKVNIATSKDNLFSLNTYYVLVDNEYILDDKPFTDGKQYYKKTGNNYDPISFYTYLIYDENKDSNYQSFLGQITVTCSVFATNLINVINDRVSAAETDAKKAYDDTAAQLDTGVVQPKLIKLEGNYNSAVRELNNEFNEQTNNLNIIFSNMATSELLEQIATLESTNRAITYANTAIVNAYISENTNTLIIDNNK